MHYYVDIVTIVELFTTTIGNDFLGYVKAKIKIT